MYQPTRREFLAGSAAGLVAVQSGLLDCLAADEKPAEMTITKWSGPELGPDEIKQAAVKLTQKAIEGLGGMKRFVKQGDVVWVKPNIGWDRRPEQAANTNPDVLATIIRMAFDAGAKVIKVGDNPCDSAAKTYESSGLAAVAKELGAKVVFVDRSRFKKMPIGGERLKDHPVYPEIVECDAVINVPIVKHHVLAKITMCMKNFMGVVDNRGVFHQALPACICDITRFMQPKTKLCVLDAVRILKAHGPKGGNLADVATKLTVAAGTDMVALDAWGAEVMGFKPADIQSIVKGAEAGLGKIDYRSLALREIAVS